MSHPLEIQATALYGSVSEEPIEADLTLGDGGITVESDELNVEIGFVDVFDVRLGSPPPAAAHAFAGTTLTVGFDRDDNRDILFATGGNETIEKFGGLLFRRLLNGTEVAVRHPAKVGGRVTDESFDIGELKVSPDEVGCAGIKVPFVVGLETIVGFSRSKEELLGEERSVITIQYVRDGVAVSLDLSINPPRKQHLLGRFLRRDYDRIRRELKSLDVPSPALRTLVKLYSLRGTAKPQSLLDGQSASTAAVLRGLADHNLVQARDGRVELTSRGWILVTEYVDDAESTSDTAAGKG